MIFDKPHYLNYRQAKITDLRNLIAMLANDPLGQTREDTTVPTNPSYLKAFNYIENDPNNMLFVVELEETLAGMFQLTLIPSLTHIGSCRYQVEGARVHQSFRSRGIERQICEFATNLAKYRECNIVQLTSDKKEKMRRGSMKA